MRKEKTFFSAGWIRVALAAILAAPLAAGCGSADNPAAPTGSGNAKARKQMKAMHVAKPGEEDVADMVSAVSATKSGPPVQLKFNLSQRPEVGQAMDVTIALIAGTPPPDSISASFQATDGIDVVDGAQLAQVEKLAEGAILRHVVKILPKRDGIFAITALVNVGTGDQKSTRIFSIPVISGEGMREQVAKGP